VIEKINIDEAKKARIIAKAKQLGDELGRKTISCSNCTFEAIIEAFKSEGIELLPAETVKMLFPGFLTLHGGMGMTGVGTCGAVSGSMWLIGHVVGITAEDLQKNQALHRAACVPAATYIASRFEQVYGATDCLRIRYNRIQRAVDLTDPDAAVTEGLFARYEPEKCGLRDVNFKGGRDMMPPVQGAGWAAEGICDILGIEPEERKKLPPHLKALGTGEMNAKYEKVIKVMKEVGFGWPNEKISYRDLYEFKTKGKKAVDAKTLGSVFAPKEY
jgi:hypothetical protein